VLSILESGGGGTAACGARLSAPVTLREELAGAVGPDGFRIQAGATIAASADVDGGLGGDRDGAARVARRRRLARWCQLVEMRAMEVA
jgi:hypothetical protein